MKTRVRTSVAAPSREACSAIAVVNRTYQERQAAGASCRTSAAEVDDRVNHYTTLGPRLLTRLRTKCLKSQSVLFVEQDKGNDPSSSDNDLAANVTARHRADIDHDRFHIPQAQQRADLASLIAAAANERQVDIAAFTAAAASELGAISLQEQENLQDEAPVVSQQQTEDSCVSEDRSASSALAATIQVACERAATSIKPANLTLNLSSRSELTQSARPMQNVSVVPECTQPVESTAESTDPVPIKDARVAGSSTGYAQWPTKVPMKVSSVTKSQQSMADLQASNAADRLEQTGQIASHQSDSVQAIHTLAEASVASTGEASVDAAVSSSAASKEALSEETYIEPLDSSDTSPAAVSSDHQSPEMVVIGIQALTEAVGVTSDVAQPDPATDHKLQDRLDTLAPAEVSDVTSAAAESTSYREPDVIPNSQGPVEVSGIISDVAWPALPAELQPVTTEQQAGKTVAAPEPLTSLRPQLHYVPPPKTVYRRGRARRGKQLTTPSPVVNIKSEQEFVKEVEEEVERPVVLYISSKVNIQSGLREEAEIHWKNDPQLLQMKRTAAQLISLLDQAAREVPQAKFGHLQADSLAARALCQELELPMLPCLQFWQKGEMLWECYGVLNIQRGLSEGLLYYADAAARGSRVSPLVPDLHSAKEVQTFVSRHADQSLTVVGYFMTSLNSCVHVFPAMFALAKAHPEVSLARVLGDEDNEMWNYCVSIGLVQAPTFVFYKVGKEVGRFVGGTKADLIGQVLRYLVPAEANPTVVAYEGPVAQHIGDMKAGAVAVST